MNQVEALAAKVNQFLYNYDPYEFINDNESIESGYETALNDILNGNISGIVATLSEIEEDESSCLIEELEEMNA